MKILVYKFQEKNFVRNIELLKYVNTLQQTNHDENLRELFQLWNIYRKER